MSQKKFEVTLHPKQMKAFKSEKRIVICCAGIQGGKSFVGALKLRKAVTKIWPKEQWPHVNFAVTAPDYKMMHQSTRDAFDRVFNGMGKMDNKLEVFNLSDKRKIFFRTMVKNPDSVEGIPNCVFIWADEAGKYPLLAYRQIVDRTALMRGQSFFTSTPYAMNWMAKEIKKFKEGEPSIDYFEWKSVENPAFPRDEYEEQKRKLPPKTFRRRYEGIHEALEGQIYEYNQSCKVDPFPIHQYPCYGGIDWGFDHPAGIAVRCIPGDGNSYTVSLMKRNGLTAGQMLDVIEAKTKLFHVKRWFCGSDRPDMIADLQSRGVPAVKYFEESPEHREVLAGIALHSEYMHQKKYKVFRDIEDLDHLEDEYASYHWDKDEKEQFTKKEAPIKENDDLMDAERYASIGIRYLMKERKVESKMPPYLQHRIDNWKPGYEDHEEKTSPEDY